MVFPSKPEFLALASRHPDGILVPVFYELSADLETPVSAYLKLAGPNPSFLLESVEGGEQLARYSFIGVNPARLIRIRGHTAQIQNHSTESMTLTRDPLAVVRELLCQYPVVTLPGLPRFIGGAVGYIGYDVVRQFERIRTSQSQPYPVPDMPDAMFMLADTLVAFDHVKHRMLIIANAHVQGDAARAYETAVARINQCILRLHQPLAFEYRRIADVSLAASAALEHAQVVHAFEKPVPRGDALSLASNMTPETFYRIVRRAQEHISAGDIFQVVLSQRFHCEARAEPFAIYRALRSLNPSPYMFFLDFGALKFIGASPEMLVRLEDGIAQLNPIAGTRRRGENEADDRRLAHELCNDPKERAEHVMLVDLGRNDLGRVCEFGTIQVRDFMQIERYSHVMHLVSRIQGVLRPDCDAFDLVRATFPAGTLTGAPKVRAMEIIDELEGAQRGPYGGAVGYFGFPTYPKGSASRLYTGNMDLCITIRTIVMHGRHAYIQAGAGIVADSTPECEYQETVNKAYALAEAIRMAERSHHGHRDRQL